MINYFTEYYVQAVDATGQQIATSSGLSKGQPMGEKKIDGSILGWRKVLQQVLAL